MEEEPLVRARHMKSMLAAADRLPDGGGGLLRRNVEPAMLRLVEESHGADWLPLESNLAVTRALHAQLGEPRFGAFFRSHQLESFRGPLLGMLVDAAVRIFGLDPGAWARWVPKGWDLVFRRVGAWSLPEIVPGRVTFRLDALPDACFEEPTWLPSVASSLGALLDLARAEGSFDLAGVDRAARRATFVMRWG